MEDKYKITYDKTSPRGVFEYLDDSNIFTYDINSHDFIKSWYPRASAKYPSVKNYDILGKLDDYLRLNGKST